MPIIIVRKQGKKGYKFGKSGKSYFGSGARNKARKQGAAIEISKARREGKVIPVKGSKYRKGTIRRI